MKLSPENLALVERIDRFRVPTGDALHEHVSICASTMEALLNAARLEGVGCCAGCGSTRPIEGLHADGYRSCCPERKILTAKEWAKRAEAAEAALAVVRRSLVEQAAARLDPEMPLVKPEIVAALRRDAEASYACAESSEERIQSHGLSLLCDWQDAARAARQSAGEGL